MFGDDDDFLDGMDDGAADTSGHRGPASSGNSFMSPPARQAPTSFQAAAASPQKETDEDDGV